MNEEMLTTSRIPQSGCQKYGAPKQVELGSEATSDGWTAGNSFPFLECLNKGGVGLDTCTFAFQISMRALESHATITNKVRQDDCGTTRDTLGG
jgi:hypothetical protein